MVIGIYDSGVGGLSVWRELRRYTNARLLYFGDTCHVPYGEKSPEQLETYFWEIVGFFQTQGCQSVVVACNTSSALVLPRVRDRLGIPVFGIIESAVQAAVAVSGGRVGVLATRGTAESGVYQTMFRTIYPQGQVFVQSAPRLVPLIEAGQITAQVTRDALKEYLAPLVGRGVDTLVLGCTHYPFLQELLVDLLGPDVRIVDPAPSLALHVTEELPLEPAEMGPRGAGTGFWVSGDPTTFQETAERLLQEKLPTVQCHPMAGERA